MGRRSCGREEAIKTFQRAAGLTEDGCFGKLTMRAAIAHQGMTNDGGDDVAAASPYAGTTPSSG